MSRVNNDPYFVITEIIFYLVTATILAYFLPFLITILVLMPLALKLYTKLTIGICKSYRRIDGKTVIVTGSNIGIGLETAKDLARRGGRIILACRSLDKGKVALDEIQRDSGSHAVVLKHLDLTSLDSVRKFCKEINSEESRLDILVNNAGLSLVSKQMTKDKMETCMQTNHFGPFLLTHLLLDLMRRTGNGRIVNVSSEMHKLAPTFDPDNLNAEKSFSAPRVYALTKLANIYFSTELDRRLKSTGVKDITVNSVHPGAVRSGFQANFDEVWYMRITNPMQRFFCKTAVEGAQTSIYVAVSEEVDGVSGEYFSDCGKQWTSNQAKNTENAGILWDRSVEATGIKAQDTIVKL